MNFKFYERTSTLAGKKEEEFTEWQRGFNKAGICEEQDKMIESIKNI